MLLIRGECWHNLGFRSVNVHANCCGVAVNCFIPASHLPVAAAAEVHDGVGIGEVGCMDIGSNLNPSVALKMLTKYPVDNMVEESR